MTQLSVSQAEARDLTVRTIGIVAYDGMELIDLTGPVDVFSLASHCFQMAGIAKEIIYPIKVLAKQAGPASAFNGLKIHAESAYTDIKNGLDTLIIPGAPDVNCLLSDPLLRDWLRAILPSVRRLVSVCTGAFLLADMGLLDGRRATTHWAYCNRLAADYPSVTVEPDRIFLRDGFISTSGGITSGIDLALALVEEDWGRELALETARYMVVFLKRPGGQSQFSGYLVSEATNHPDLRALQVWMMEHPAEDLRIEALAERVAMSPRNFARIFQTETGMTPAKFVEKIRIDAARHYLGESDLRIETVALKAGFTDPERMRRTFIRHLGISPNDYRARFSRSDPEPPPALTERDNAKILTSLTKY
jgi:transcriptional regulator GlxA family with amidase domain